jgi:uncharacterized protein (DUF302 family)
MTGVTLREQNGVVRVRSTVPLAKTIESLLVALGRRGMALHARIDHAKGAEAVGLELRPTCLFVFGYAEAEAPIIAKSELLAIDLPQRIIVWEDEDAVVWIAYNDPVWLSQRHGASPGVKSLIEAIRTSLSGIILEAGGMAD